MRSKILSFFEADKRYSEYLDRIFQDVHDEDLAYVTEEDLFALADEDYNNKVSYILKLFIRRHLKPLLGTALDKPADEPKPADKKDERPAVVRDPQPGDARLELDGSLFNKRGFDISFLSDCGPDLGGVSTRKPPVDPLEAVSKWDAAAHSPDAEGTLLVQPPLLVVPPEEEARDLDYTLEVIPIGRPDTKRIVFQGLHDNEFDTNSVPVLSKIADAFTYRAGRLPGGPARLPHVVEFRECRLDTSRVSHLRRLAECVDLVVTPNNRWSSTGDDDNNSGWFNRVIWLDEFELEMPGLDSMLETMFGEETAKAVVAAHKAYYAKH